MTLAHPTKGAVQLDNTLTSTSTVKALTAAQGKVLKDAVDGLVAGSTPTSIWSGDSSSVSDGDILASSGFVVSRGLYSLKSFGLDITYIVPVFDLSLTSSGTSTVSSISSNISIACGLRESGAFKVEQLVNGSAVDVGPNIAEILYVPL